MRLLHQQYQERPEAQSFQKDLEKIRDKYQDSFRIVHDKLNKKSKKPDEFGESRNQTETYLAATTIKGWLGGLLSLPWVIQNAISLLPILRDPIYIKSQMDMAEYLRQYREYLKKLLGGTFKINVWKFWRGWFSGKSVWNYASSHRNRHIARCFEYQHEILRLCWKHGLKSWWPPLLNMEDDLIKLHPPTPVKESRVTPDGLLGPFFPRMINIKVEEGKSNLSNSKLPEWKLIGMSGKQKRQELGPQYTHVVDQYLETIGYENNKKWVPEHFEMLFDRLYLKSSIEEIAEKRHCDEATVKRVTNVLFDLVGIEPPRATKSKHIKH